MSMNEEGERKKRVSKSDHSNHVLVLSLVQVLKELEGAVSNVYHIVVVWRSVAPERARRLTNKGVR